MLQALEGFVLKLNKAAKFSEIFRLLIEKGDANRLDKGVLVICIL